MPHPMAPPDLAMLKAIRNQIIGSPSAKVALLRSQLDFLSSLLPLLSARDADSSPQFKSEAIHIIGSLCREMDCLPFLLEEGTTETLVATLGDAVGTRHQSSEETDVEHATSPVAGPSTPTTPQVSNQYIRATAKALADLVRCICEAVHGARYGIGRPRYPAREAAYLALENLLQLELLDCVLPLLAAPPPTSLHGIGNGQQFAAATTIADLISHLRTLDETAPILAWLPVKDRLSAAKGKRGWEKKEEGGWVVGRLCAMLKSNDEKAHIAALNALTTLLTNNPHLITTFGRFHAPVAQRIFDLSRSRSPPVRLAACFTLTALLCHKPARPTGLRPVSDADTPPPSSLLLNVLATLQGLVDDDREEGEIRSGACWCLATLVQDDRTRAVHAVQTGLLRSLCNLLRSFPPIDPSSPSSLDELWEEPLPTVHLREACMTALAMLTFPDQGLRSQLAEQKPSVLPIIHASLSHPAPAVRHAACQDIRALSRSVAILRSSLVDEGVALSILGLVMREGQVKEEEGLEGFGLPEEEDDVAEEERDADDSMDIEDEEPKGKEKEIHVVKGDRRVLLAALAALCNFTADFSPVQHQLLEQGALPVLVKYATNPHDGLLRMNGLWVLKNLVYRADWSLKKNVMDLMGWDRFVQLCRDEDLRAREQALSMIRNLAAIRDSDVIHTVRGIEAGELVALVEEAMNTGNDDVVMNALLVIVNTVSELYKSSPPCTLHRSPTFLNTLLSSLSSPNQALRMAAIRVIHALLQINVGKEEMREFGIERRVREMDGARYKGGLGGSIGRKSMSGLGDIDGGDMETSLEVREIVKKVADHFDAA